MNINCLILEVNGVIDAINSLTDARIKLYGIKKVAKCVSEDHLDYLIDQIQKRENELMHILDDIEACIKNESEN